MAFAVIASEEEDIEKAGEETRGARRRLWSREWLLRREEGSQYRILVQGLALEDYNIYQNWMRVNRAQFNRILDMIHHSISKMDTRLRKAVTPQERLAITLRYLATDTPVVVPFQ